jgi:hypothetical protein
VSGPVRKNFPEAVLLSGACMVVAPELCLLLRIWSFYVKHVITLRAKAGNER